MNSAMGGAEEMVLRGGREVVPVVLEDVEEDGAAVSQRDSCISKIRMDQG